MKKYKQVMSVVRGQWSVAKGYKREDRRQMAGGKNIKTILHSWLLATGFSSRAGLRTGQVGIMKCHFGRVQRPANPNVADLLRGKTR